MSHVAPAEADDLGRDPVYAEHRRAGLEPVRRAGRPRQQGVLLSHLGSFLHLRPYGAEAEASRRNAGGPGRAPVPGFGRGRGHRPHLDAPATGAQSPPEWQAKPA